jgi:hypothetical protein
MRQWTIINDQLRDLGERTYVGYPYDDIKAGKVEVLPEDYDGWFPFARLCYSIGDLAITSGIFEALKTKYPKIKIAWPSDQYLRNFHARYPGMGFGKGIDYWNYNDKVTSINNIHSIIDNNPYIDYYFNEGEFDYIFTDHERSYTSLQQVGDDHIRSADEPLAEQILRRFGFNDDDIKNIDSTPKIYFTKEEEVEFDEIIKSHVGDNEYGCLLFASRVEKYKGRWDKETLLYEDAERFKNKPVFYYSQFDLKNTKWEEFFPNRINFKELGLSIRAQIYIKRKALFNLSYQAGITDASSGGNSEVITLTAYTTIHECAIRNTKCIYFDGSVKHF